MRAKTINEDNNFTRGMSPKAAMGVGGIVFKDIIEQRRKKLDWEKEKLTHAADKKWQADLRKMLVGKTITGHMQKLPMIDKNNNTVGKSEWKTFTIVVQDVLMEKLEDSSIIIGDMNNNLYSIRFETWTGKIYIE